MQPELTITARTLRRLHVIMTRIQWQGEITQEDREDVRNLGFRLNEDNTITLIGRRE